MKNVPILSPLSSQSKALCPREGLNVNNLTNFSQRGFFSFNLCVRVCLYQLMFQSGVRTLRPEWPDPIRGLDTRWLHIKPQDYAMNLQHALAEPNEMRTLKNDKYLYILFFKLR